MADVGIVMIVVGLGVTGVELLVVWKGAGDSEFFGAQARVARYLWRIAAAVAAAGFALAIVGALLGS